MRKITTRTTPSARRQVLLPVFLARSPLRRSALIHGPFFDTAQVEDRPAKLTRPHFRSATQLAATNGAFVQIVCNILVDSGSQIIGCGFHRDLRWLPCPSFRFAFSRHDRFRGWSALGGRHSRYEVWYISPERVVDKLFCNIQ
jgi:hypothetical protein